jgi:hypothetical protein
MDIFRATIKIKRKHQLSDNTLIYEFDDNDDDNDDDIDYD